MDRMLFLSAAGATETLAAQAVAANNLANVSTTGFRADFAQARSMPLFGPGHPSRVFAMTEGPGVDLNPGVLQSTGRSLDVAVQGRGFIAVQGPDGREGYTRAGDLRITASGLLETGTGHLVLGNGGPIAVPPAETVSIAGDGTLSIRPVGQDARTLAVVDRIRLVDPEPTRLVKSADGLLRTDDGEPVEADAAVQMVSGVLETSNVNAVGALVDMIALARSFELQVRSMETAQEGETATSQMLNLS